MWRHRKINDNSLAHVMSSAWVKVPFIEMEEIGDGIF